MSNDSETPQREGSGHFVKQAGVIPYRREQGQIRILLITARRSRRWIVPKGNIEPDLTSAQSAEMEAYEEAGIRGNIHQESVGTYQYQKLGASYRVQLFLMEVTLELEDWQESHIRERQWVGLSEARDLVDVALLKKIFANFEHYLT